MKTCGVSLAVLLFLCSWAVAQVSLYSGTVQIRPDTSEIDAALTVTIIPPRAGLRDASFLLNKGVEIQGVECRECSGYSFDRSQSKVYQYAPEGSPLVARFKRLVREGKKVQIQIRYRGKLSAHPMKVNYVSPEWVEMGMYLPWFPFSPGASSFLFDITVTVPPDYKVSGNGIITKTRHGWDIKSDRPAKDIVVVASRDLKTRTIHRGRFAVRLDYVEKDNAGLSRVAEECGWMLDFYSAKFGTSASGELTVVVNPRESGGWIQPPRIYIDACQVEGRE